MFITRLILILAGVLICRQLHSQDISAVNTNDISLEDLLDTKVSSASKYEQKISEAPASVTIISSEDISKYGYKTLADVLNSESGFFISDDRNYTYIGTRGFQMPASYNNKILVLMDGHTINDPVYGGSYFNNEMVFDLTAVEKIEIVRGPGSALYGTNALFAVVNIVSKKGKRIDGVNVQGLYGSYNTMDFKLTSGYEVSEDFSFILSGIYGSSDGRDFYFSEYDKPEYDNNGNAAGIDNNKYYGGYASLKVYDFSLSMYYSKHDKHCPTAKFETIFNSKDFKEFDERAFVELLHNINFSESISLSSRVYYDYYGFEGYYPYQDEDNPGYRYTEYETNKGNNIGCELRSDIDILENLRLTLGTEINISLVNDYNSYLLAEKTLGLNEEVNLYSGYSNITYQIFNKFLSNNSGIFFV